MLILVEDVVQSSKYYAHIQTAVTRGLGLPTRRLAGRHTDAVPTLLYHSVSECASTYICKAETLVFTDCDYCYMLVL